MESTNKYIIGSAVYLALQELLADADYVKAVNTYKYQLGLESVAVSETETDETRIALGKSPNVYPFFYNGSFDELCMLYNHTTGAKKGIKVNSNRYVGIWNILPMQTRKSGNYLEMQTEINFVCSVNKDWSTEQRDAKLFVPIFDKLKESLMKNIAKYPFVVCSNGIDYTESRGYNVLGAAHDEIGDYVSFMRLETTLKIFISECDKYDEEIKGNYLKLINLIN